MKSDPLTLKDIFEKQRCYAVPLFQRAYVWNKDEQWAPLWEDVKGVAERILRDKKNGSDKETPPHFMGTVVLDLMDVPTRMIDARQIVDGQQRLVTLQLLMAAARDAGRTVGTPADQYCDDLNFLTVNRVRSDTPDVSFKVWPTNPDREDFRQVMGAGSPTKVRQAYQTKVDSAPIGRPIPDAYLFFYDEALKWLKPDEGNGVADRLEALEDTLYAGLNLVVIDLGVGDNAQMIFETLNARGTPLLAADLAKNYLLQLANEKKLSSEALYTKYWKPFDDDKFWREKVPQGRLFRPRMDVYLQHFLTLTIKEDIPASNMFVTFRKHVKTHDDGPETYLASLRRYGDIFRDIYRQPTGTRGAVFFRRIVETMETTTIFPILLEVFDRLPGATNAAARSAILTDLESFLIRRMICVLPTRNYNRLFLDLLQALKPETVDLGLTIREFLAARTSPNERWPSDAEFQAAWLEKPIYENITRGRLRMVLEALELALRTSKTEDVPLPKTLTIEHLMPQSWEQNWPLPTGKADAAQVRSTLLHTIGNLTLVTQSLNSAASNDAWMPKDGSLGKRATLDNHSVLCLKQSFKGIDPWNEDTIVERGKALFKVALKLWPRPA